MVERKEGKLGVKFNGPNFNLDFNIEASESFVRDLAEKTWDFLENKLIPFLQTQLKIEKKERISQESGGERKKESKENEVKVPEIKPSLESKLPLEETKKFESKAEFQPTRFEEKKVTDLELRKFYDRKRPKTRIQKLLVFAYYLKHFKNKPEFTSNDIKQCYQSIGEKLPPRFTQDVYDAISKYGYVERGDKKGLYRLSDKGEQAVDVMGMED